MGLTGLKSRHWQGPLLSGGSRGGPITLPFWLLEATCTPWLVVTFLHLQSLHGGWGSNPSPSAVLRPLSLPVSSICKYPMITLGHLESLGQSPYFRVS